MATALERLAHFHSVEAETLRLRYRQVEDLIGAGHHSASEGDYCEDLLRSFLRAALPGRFSVDTGFVSSATAAGLPEEGSVSPQLDIIIHDATDHAPLFRSGEFVVVLPDAVAGIIEVKKRLTSGELKDALEKLAVTRHRALISGCNAPRPFTGVFAFTADDGLRPKSKTVSDTYPNRLRKICHRYAPVVALPDAIVVVDQHIFFRDDLEGGPAKPITVRRTAAQVGDLHIAGQALLWMFTVVRRLPESASTVRRFAFPDVESSEQVVDFTFTTTPAPDAGPARESHPGP